MSWPTQATWSVVPFFGVARGAGHRADCRAQIPSLPVLGDYRSLNDIRHYVGRLCRSLARHWIYRRVAAAVHLPHGRARHLALVGGHNLGEQRKHATSRGLLLGGDHLFTDTRNRARRLDRRGRLGYEGGALVF